MTNRPEQELIPSRLNEDPPVFRGCSLNELTTIGGMALVVCVPGCMFLLGLFGYTMMGVGVGVLASIAGVALGATQLQRMKRGRPIGYYQLQIRLMLDQYGIKRIAVVKKGAYWDIGRSIDVRKRKKAQKKR